MDEATKTRLVQLVWRSNVLARELAGITKQATASGALASEQIMIEFQKVGGELEDTQNQMFEVLGTPRPTNDRKPTNDAVEDQEMAEILADWEREIRTVSFS